MAIYRFFSTERSSDEARAFDPRVRQGGGDDPPLPRRARPRRHPHHPRGRGGVPEAMSLALSTGRMIELAVAVVLLVAGLWFYRRRDPSGGSYGGQGADPVRHRRDHRRAR